LALFITAPSEHIGEELVGKENIGEELVEEKLAREELVGEELIGEELAREEHVVLPGRSSLGRRGGARRGAKDEFREELIEAPGAKEEFG
jgi:hypothetical protein